MDQETLRESATLTLDPSSGKGIWRSCLIEADVQGSSGFYPADVLRRDGAIAFPAGTHVYFDHPTDSEEAERPERSILDIAGYLLDGAKFEEGPDGRGLFAQIQFTEKAKPIVRQLAKIVGLSIRAAGQVEETPSGERVVRSISEGLSVDVVTRAGAGGRLVSMTESASPGSPPAVQNVTVTPAVTATPSTLGSGDLRNEVAALKETFSDRIEELTVGLARNTEQLRESRREGEKQTRENAKLAEAINYLRDRAQVADSALKESLKSGDALKALLESGLPVASQIRVAESYRPDEDLHEKINHEREYAKKLLRESERGSLERRESSNLGLTEAGKAENSYAPRTDSDVSEIRDLLSGGPY